LSDVSPGDSHASPLKKPEPFSILGANNMPQTKQLILLAEYNQLMNQRQYNASKALSDAKLNEDRGAFFKSILLLGIKDRHRRHFWKLFFWSLFRRPHLFVDAITYAIYGYHFRKVFEDYL
jgi:hypothetical protein